MKPTLAAILLLGITIPLRADTIITGTYTGTETWTQFTQTPTGDVETTGVGPATFEFASFQGGLGLALLMDGVAFQGAAVDWVLTATSAAGGVETGLPGVGPSGGFFAATFDSIAPGGAVVGGSATANFEVSTFSSVTYTQFVSTVVPEPSSWVLAAIACAVVAIGIFSGFRAAGY